MGQKFRQNRSIVHGFQDTSIFVFSLFGKFVMINLLLGHLLLGHFLTNQCQK